MRLDEAKKILKDNGYILEDYESPKSTINYWEEVKALNPNALDQLEEDITEWILDAGDIRKDVDGLDSGFVVMQDWDPRDPHDSIYDNIVRIPDNAKPYQKILLNIHHQTPAYFMQCVAAGMHEYNENGERIEIFGINKNKIDLAATKFGYRYTIPKLTTLITGGTGFIENPHMLESYYALSKEINTTDFR